MRCRDCPYGEEDFTQRITHEDVDAEQNIWCDKVGGKLLYYGRCSDCHRKTEILHNHYKKRRKSKRDRDEKYKSHLIWLSENVSGYSLPVIYKDEVWVKEYGYIENQKPYYKRCYRDNHKGGRYKYYKKYANRMVRRYKGIITKGGMYKKIFDYWWNVD